MENKHTSLKALFSDIANAIRSKTNTSDSIVADDFPDVIRNLVTETHELEDALVSGEITSYTNDRVTGIRRFTFYGNRVLRTVSFASVTVVKEQAFHDCLVLTTAHLPQLKEIDIEGFAGCVKLESLTAPKLNVLLDKAFRGCRRLRYVEMSYTNDAGFPQNELYGDPFEDSGITSLVLRGSGLFECDARLKFLSTPIAEGTGYIYVHSALLETYKTNEYWSAFASQFRALEDYTVDGTVDGELDKSKI